MTFKEGDYFYSHEKDDNGDFVYSITRCLKIDEEHGIAHVTIFQPLLGKPTESDIDDLELFIMHLPINVDGFENPVVFANRPVTKDELDGYYAYLKMADFQAYLEETGADIDAITQEAERLFDEATKLGDAGDFVAAAEKYYECYDTFPLYFEALDNAALCLMDAGDYETAMDYFHESIDCNDNTFMTDYGIATCYDALEDIDNARAWYEQALARPDITPEQRDDVQSRLAEF